MRLQMAELRGRHDNKVYRPLEELGSGGEGAVYSIVGDPNRVMKIYHDPKPELISKITKMVESNLKDSKDVSFPEELIFDGNRFRGYVMKRVKGESFSSVYAISSKKRPVPQEVRFTIAKNLCIALSNVHQAGFVFGDFNPANIKVDVKRRTVTLMDTDSFVFDSYGGIVARPEMVPLEIRQAMRRNESLPDERKSKLPFSKESDIFTLAVHLFRLLMNGEHPFIYKPTRSLAHQPMYAYEFDPPTFPYIDNKLGIAPPPHAVPLESIPPELQLLFVRTFREGYSDPAMRPSIDDFFDEIDRYEKSSVQCARDSGHRFHSSQTACPFCAANQRYAQALGGRVPATVPVSKVDYILDLDYDFILAHPEKIGLVRKKAQSGSSESYLVLGRLYSDGIIEEQNDRKAAENFLKASMSKRPSMEAQYRLGLCFLDGIGVPQSKPDAIKWLSMAAQSGYVPAQQLMEYVDTLDPIGPPVTADIDTVHAVPIQMEEPVFDMVVPEDKPKRTRRSPQQKCIDDVVLGDESALRRLHGFILSDKIDWDETTSVHEPFKDAADRSPEFAFLYYEVLKKTGHTDDSDKYLLSAAEGGYVPAMVHMGQLYIDFNIPDMARDWYERAMLQDDSIRMPEVLKVDESPKPARKRGGLGSFIDKIKGLWNRKS